MKKYKTGKLKIFVLCSLLVLFIITAFFALFGKLNNDKQVRSLKNQIIALKKDNELLKTRYDNYTIEFENLFNEYNKAINELSEQRTIIVDLTRERDNYLESRNAYYEQCQILSEQKTTLENDKKILQDTVSSKESEITNLNSQIAILNKNIVDKDSQITALKNSINEKDKDIAEKQTKITTLENEKSTLITEKESLQNTINNKNNEIDDLNNQIVNLNASIIEKDKTISDNKKIIEEKTSKITELENKITNLESDITNKTAQIETLQNTITSLNNKIFELEKKIDYTITYIVGEETTTQTVKGHSTATLLDKPIKTDLTFDGWYDSLGVKIESTTVNITNNDITLNGYFKCLITCGNEKILINVGASLGNENTLIPIGIDGVTYTYYLNGDKTKSYSYEEICNYKFVKNSTITYEETLNNDIDYSFNGSFDGWDKSVFSASSFESTIQRIDFRMDKSSNSGHISINNGSIERDFAITSSEDGSYMFVIEDLECPIMGVFALKRGLTGDVSTLFNKQNYAWHFGLSLRLGSCVGENCEFNKSIAMLKNLQYIFSANLDGTFDTNFA